MDEDDFFTSKPSDPLTLLVRQDLRSAIGR